MRSFGPDVRTAALLTADKPGNTIVRTPNGNDYGKDLLRQHLLAEHVGKY